MFTGIIESLGNIQSLSKEGSNLHLRILSPISSELKIDQSIAHNGVCLTVTRLGDDWHEVTAIQETLNKTNLGELKMGDPVNLERCMKLSDRVDGHIVQGHVDQKAECISRTDENGSFIFTFRYNDESDFTIEKGSITVNGVSLTVVNSHDNEFSVAIIPYTLEHTTFGSLNPGDKVNLEFDILGKYVQEMMRRRGI
jgi:riboflavin synthase